MAIIEKTYLHALGGYAELIHTASEEFRYMLQINWNMSRIEDLSRKVMVDYFSDQTQAQEAYRALVTDTPQGQIMKLSAWFNGLNGNGAGPEIANGDIEILRSIFKAEPVSGDMDDPHRGATYALHNKAAIYRHFNQDDREGVRSLLDRICEDYGVVRPDLVIGQEEIKAFKEKYRYEDEDFVAEPGGVYISHPLTIILSEADESFLLHEAAHFLEDCMSDCDVYTAHGEMFNRIHLQLLQRYAPDVNVRYVFEQAKHLGIFRRELSFDEVMKPIGLLSDEPVLYPYDEPQP